MLKRYWSDRTEIEYEGVQLTPENMEEVAEHFQLEHVKGYSIEDDIIEEALFRPGRTEIIRVGDFVLQALNSKVPPFAVHPDDFDHFYKEIQVHPYVPQIMYSDSELYPSPCVFCGHSRDSVPYHRDGIPGEVLKLPDGGTLRIIVR